MKYLIAICLTSIAIAFLTNAAWIQTTEIKAAHKMRVLMFREYARTHKGQPRVEVPTDKGQSGSDLKREKL